MRYSKTLNHHIYNIFTEVEIQFNSFAKILNKELEKMKLAIIRKQHSIFTEHSNQLGFYCDLPFRNQSQQKWTGMVINVHWTSVIIYFTVYANTESLHCIPETNIMLINHT